MGCGCKHIVRGVVGLTKALVGWDRADDTTIRHRRRCCKKCPHVSRSTDLKYQKTNGVTTLSQCGMCKCFVAAKITIKGEACPLGKW